MSGPKRNPDKLNTIGIVVVGICGAVMVYVTIVALQAFYMGDTADMQANKDFGGMDTAAKGHKADEMRNITEAASNPNGTYRIPIDCGARAVCDDSAMALIVRDAEKDPSHLVPALPPSTKPTIEPVFGRPKLLGAAPAPTDGAQPATNGAAPAGAGSAAPAGAGSAAAPAGAGAGSAAAPAGAGAPAGAAPAGAGAGSAAHAAAPQTPTGAAPGPAAGASPAKAAAQPAHAGSAAPTHAGSAAH